ncbi:MATE family efflux transporter [Nitratifractor sp.]
MNREILRLALPNILANISVPLISSVDTALMGHLSAAHLAALGVGGMLFMFLYSNFGFLRMGTTGMVAQAFGARERRLLATTLYRAVLLALALSLPMILLQEPLFRLASWLMNVEPDYRPLLESYYGIRIWTAPAVMLLYVLTGFYFGMQNARYPLYATLLVNLLNIALSLYLVRILDWGIAGAAWGTVAAQYGGLLFSLWLLRRYRRDLPRVSWAEIFHLDALRRFFHVNRNIFIRTVALTFALAFFYAQAAKGGETTLSVMILLMQFMIWMSFAIDGFANAAESLVGRAVGAEDREGFRRAVRLSLAWGAGLALLFSLVYLLLGEEILRIYTDQRVVVERTMELLPLAALLPILSFAAFIYDGIFIGMTAVRAMRNAVLSAMLLYLGIYYLLALFLPLSWALWIAFLSFFLFRGLLQGWMFWRKGWELK